MVFTLTNKMTSKQWHGGKGSQRRNTNDKAYADNWEAIFGKKKKPNKPTEQTKDKHDKEI